MVAEKSATVCNVGQLKIVWPYLLQGPSLGIHVDEELLSCHWWRVVSRPWQNAVDISAPSVAGKPLNG